MPELVMKQPGKQGISLVPPLSKSDAIRQVILRHIVGRPQTPSDDVPEDVLVVLRGLELLNSKEKEIDIHAGLGGAPLRFLAGLAFTTPGKKIRLHADSSLQRRPHQPLVNALRQLARDVNIECDFGWPWTLDTREANYRNLRSVVVEPTSSQYVTSLLFLAAQSKARNEIESFVIKMEGKTASSSYLELTIDWLRDTGFSLKEENDKIELHEYSVQDSKKTVPLDWSSAAYLIVWAWKTGNRVTVSPDAKHADATFVELLRSAGLLITITGDQLETRGNLQSGFKFDVAGAPDLALVLATLAFSAPAKSVFHNIGILRHKESDRLAFILDLANQVGAYTELVGDQLVIHPATRRIGKINIQSEKDHRRIMSAACLLPLGWQKIVVDSLEHVKKSFPGFLMQVGKCGLVVTG